MSFKPDLKDAPRQIITNSELKRETKRRKQQWDKENDDGIGIVFIALITVVVIGVIISLLEWANWIG